MKKFIFVLLLSVISLSHADEKNIIDSISDNNSLQKLHEFVSKSDLSKNLLDYISKTKKARTRRAIKTICDNVFTSCLRAGLFYVLTYEHGE